MFSSTIPLSSIFTLSFFSYLVTADFPNFNNSISYQRGHYGDYPVQSYISNPEIVAPVANVLTEIQDGQDSVSSNEYILWTPVAPHSPYRGPSILDAKTLSLVYQAPVYDKENIGATIQQCNGTDYMTWWSGKGLNGRKAGKYMMFSNNYTNVYNISSVGLHYADAHEFFLTPNCTAVLTAYQAREYDLTAYGLKKGYLLDSYFQEVDVATNKLLFTWQASTHVNVSDSFLTPNISGQGHTIYDPFDFFHINSVEKDDKGNYLVSSRHMHSIYYIDGKTGNITWTLGGQQNQFSDLSKGEATNFAWQHHARWTSAEHKAISIYDNRNSKYENNATLVSRGLVVSLDTANMTAKINATYKATSNITSIREGSVQLHQSSNTVLLGYGNEPGFTEFAIDGTVLRDIRFGPLLRDRRSADNYRALKVTWTGNPTSIPSIAAGPANAETLLRGGKAHLRFNRQLQRHDTVYFSWNGATEVVKWKILASNASAAGLDSEQSVWTEVVKMGFESHVRVGGKARFVRALAVDKDERILGATPVLDMQTGETSTQAFDLDVWNAAKDVVVQGKWVLLQAGVTRVKQMSTWKIVAGIAGAGFGIAVLGCVFWVLRRRTGGEGVYEGIGMADEKFERDVEGAVHRVGSEGEALMEYDERQEYTRVEE